MHHADLASFAFVKALLEIPQVLHFSLSLLITAKPRRIRSSCYNSESGCIQKMATIESSELEVEQLNDVNTRDLFELRLGDYFVDSETMSGLGEGSWR